MLSKYKEKLKEKGEVYLRIKVRPGAVENKIQDILSKDEEEETIKIDIDAQAERGRANQGLINFLSKEFEISKNNVRIISGAGERVKLVKIKEK